MCKPHKHPTRADERGFTLVEIMVVVVIIGLLAGLVGPAVLGRQADAQRETARSDIASIASVVEIYMINNGQKIPDTLSELLEPDRNGQPWIRNANVEDGQIVDPWGNPYEIHQGEGLSFNIVCAGPDGEIDTDDDIRFKDDE